jgi:hypothetical protein
MPYADVTKRRTYHAEYMQQWRARQARPTHPHVSGATPREASRWARKAQRLQAAAVELHTQAHDATTPLAVLLTLRSVTALVVEITGVLVTLPALAPHTADLPRRVAPTNTLAVKPLQPEARALAAQVDKAFDVWTVPFQAQRVLRQMAALLVHMTSEASGEAKSPTGGNPV